MSIPPDSRWRGCAANFPQPMNAATEREAQDLVRIVDFFNCCAHIANPPLADIEYRSSRREGDILNHVFRWDLSPYQEVFQTGFQARRQPGTPEKDYYNLERYVFHVGGRPLDSRRETTHAFLSTTLNRDWHPTVPLNEVYRYEIYAPGGIWVAQTLGDRYRYSAQDEVCFVAGIAPQYIRSAQCFRIILDGRDTRRERLENVITVNSNYNPQSHPPRLLDIRRPIFDYPHETMNSFQPLTTKIWFERESQEAHSNTSTDWYAGDVANSEIYNINAAFRSSHENEAYIFMNNEYVLLKYAPGTKNEWDTYFGPLHICFGYPSLTGTAFAEYGIDCAFGSHDRDQAFIFSGHLCAQINYAPHSTDDWIIKGPLTIRDMFPFLKETVFANGIDAAFESSRKYEAYLFKDDKYALINYGSAGCLISNVKLITDGYHSLKNTIFATGFDAAFASHRTNEAYLFKGDSYALINFAPGATNDYIIGGVKKILPIWPSLRDILLLKNRGFDVHPHQVPQKHRDQDELLKFNLSSLSVVNSITAHNVWGLCLFFVLSVLIYYVYRIGPLE